MVWLPALCKKMDVPYCIVKDKSRLGTVTRQKTCAAVAFTSVRKEDQHSLDQLKSTFKAMYNDVTRHPWGGGIMGLKTQRKLEKREQVAYASSRRSNVASRSMGGEFGGFVYLLVAAMACGPTPAAGRRIDEGRQGARTSGRGTPYRRVILPTYACVPGYYASRPSFSLGLSTTARPTASRFRVRA